jgi:hypothetical protein
MPSTGVLTVYEAIGDVETAVCALPSAGRCPFAVYPPLRAVVFTYCPSCTYVAWDPVPQP